jgi:hypothetical protein
MLILARIIRLFNIYRGKISILVKFSWLSQIFTLFVHYRLVFENILSCLGFFLFTIFVDRNVHFFCCYSYSIECENIFLHIIGYWMWFCQYNADSLSNSGSIESYVYAWCAWACAYRIFSSSPLFRFMFY